VRGVWRSIHAGSPKRGHVSPSGCCSSFAVYSPTYNQLICLSSVMISTRSYLRGVCPVTRSFHSPLVHRPSRVFCLHRSNNNGIEASSPECSSQDHLINQINEQTVEPLIRSSREPPMWSLASSACNPKIAVASNTALLSLTTLAGIGGLLGKAIRLLHSLGLPMTSLTAPVPHYPMPSFPCTIIDTLCPFFLCGHSSSPYLHLVSGLPLHPMPRHQWAAGTRGDSGRHIHPRRHRDGARVWPFPRGEVPGHTRLKVLHRFRPRPLDISGPRCRVLPEAHPSGRVRGLPRRHHGQREWRS